jgi:hypothetical protein
MLNPGNQKLGIGRRIWSFSVPSRTTCPGRSTLCSSAWYSHHREQHRPSLRRRYQKNLILSQKSDFVPRVIAFIRRKQIAIVRIHVGGDFYDARYARRWLTIMQTVPEVRFFFSSRSWRLPAIHKVFASTAWLPHVRVWFSCDAQTGLPRQLPDRVHLAWLMTRSDDLPPRADLVFRLRRLRRRVCNRVSWQRGQGQALVCPVENGVTGHRTTCSQCGVCWKPLPQDNASYCFGMPLLDNRDE